MTRQNYSKTAFEIYSIPILSQLMAVPNIGTWFATKVHPVFTNDNRVTLDKLEKIFLEGWVDNVTRTFHETQLHIFAWGSETAISFVNRMTALYVSRHISLKATRVETPEIAQLIRSCSFVYHLQFVALQE